MPPTSDCIVRPEIIIGCPGSGKTTALLEVLDEELKRGVPPDRIGFVSFTRKAANEAAERACKKFNLTRDDFPHFSTIHALAFRQLGMKRGSILEGTRMQDFAKHVGVTIEGKWSEDGTMSGVGLGDRIIFMDNLARVRGISLRQQYDSDDDGLPWSEVSRVTRALVEYKRAYDLMDFTDLLAEFIRSGIRLRLRSLLVDESQDNSFLQWKVVDQISEGCERVVVAGDDEQAIFQWSGADVEHFIDMKGDVRVLGQSWRCPPVIQQIARNIIERVRKRRPKQWEARTGGVGEIKRASTFWETEINKEGSVLILARNTFLLVKQVLPELRRRGVVYEYHGHSSVRPGLLEAIIDWERLRKGQKIMVTGARRIYDWMGSQSEVSRGFKKLPEFTIDEEEVSIDDLRNRGGLLTNEPWFLAFSKIPVGEIDYLRKARAHGEQLGGKPRVVVSTIHGAKGGEADEVILLKELASRTEKEMRRNPDDERRVSYVGVTRAKEKLTLVDSSNGLRPPWL